MIGACQFFKTTNEEVDNQIAQSIVDFMNENASIETTNQEDKDPYENIHKPFSNKSSWKPNPPNRTLDTFKIAFRQDLLMSNKNKPTQPNLSKDEWKGLLELKKNPNIIIKKADKGLAVVIMDTVDYLKEGYRQLSDPNFYTYDIRSAQNLSSFKSRLKTYLFQKSFPP